MLRPMASDDRRYFDEIQVGEAYESPGRTVTEADIVMFAGLSGDYNVLHTDAEFMKSSIFGERIARLSFVSERLRIVSPTRSGRSTFQSMLMNASTTSGGRAIRHPRPVERPRAKSGGATPISGASSPVTPA